LNKWLLQKEHTPTFVSQEPSLNPVKKVLQEVFYPQPIFKISMGRSSKGFSLLLAVILAVSSLIMVESASAQSIPKPSVPEFTVKLVDNSYDVPATTTSIIDSYNNKTITRTFPASHVQNITVELTVANQHFPATIDGNTSFLYYNLRTKPHFGDNWAQQYNETTHIGTLTSQSSSQYTVLFSAPVDDFNIGDQVDYQVKAILGYQYTTYEYLEHLSPNYDGPYPVPVNHTAFVESSDWSPTQTFIMPSISSPNSGSFHFSLNTQVAIFSAVAIVALSLAIIALLLYKRNRKMQAT
jgi:hypothetical protein